MSSSKYWDINLPGFSESKESENTKKYITGVDDFSKGECVKPASEFRILSLKLIIPAEGIAENAPFEFEGEIEKTAETIFSRITIDVVTTYKNNPENNDVVASNIEASLDGLHFSGKGNKLFYNIFYKRDTEKTADTTFTVQLVAKSRTAEKEFCSEVYVFPLKQKTIVLKQGCFDDTGVRNYPDRCVKGGDGYVEGNVVERLQKNLVRFRLLDKNGTDGDFGAKTETAVRAFQEYAKKPERLKMKDGLLTKIKNITYTGETNGVVEDKTQKEVILWYQEEYVRPVPVLRYNDYDETWVKNGVGQKETGEFHESSPVISLQKDLKNVGLYENAQDDGYFFDKTKAAILSLQEAASKGEFAKADNTRVVLDEKLQGYQKGAACPTTIDYLKKLIEKGLKCVKTNQNVFPLRKENCTKFKRNFGQLRGKNRNHAGCDLIAPVGTPILAVADGVVKRYCNFYWQTYELVVDHTDFVVRYGEVQPPEEHCYDNGPPRSVCNGLADGVCVGAKVCKGQHIAYVGQLRRKVGNKVENYFETMLHFELYKGSCNAVFDNLTDMENECYLFVHSGKYYRRQDLQNPTDFLEKIFI